MTKIEPNRYLKLAIHQPNFIPRLKVLQKLANADIWCVLDSVQYCVREWQSRTRIIPMHGDNKPFWLSLPVKRPKGRSSLISEILLENPSSTSVMFEKTLYHAFHLSPYWSTIQEFVTYAKNSILNCNLTRLCVETTNVLLNLANKKPTIIYSSSLPIEGKASTLIASICRYLECENYLTDSGSRNYMLPDHFNGINVLWQNWREPLFNEEDISSWRNVGSINYLSRYGPEEFSRHLVNAKFSCDENWCNKLII